MKTPREIQLLATRVSRHLSYADRNLLLDFLRQCSDKNLTDFCAWLEDMLKEEGRLVQHA